MREFGHRPLIKGVFFSLALAAASTLQPIYAKQADEMSSSVVFRANDGIEVSVGEIKSYMRGQPGKKTEESLKSKGIVELAIENIYMKKFFAQEAARLDLIPPAALHEIVEDFARSQLTNAFLSREVAMYMEGINWEQLAQEHFIANRSRFMSEETRSARHILVPYAVSDEGLDPFQKIQSVRQELLSGGTFTELAKKYSADTASAKAGGDLGYFGRGRMQPQFEQIVWQLEVGQISQPVATQFGFHIIEVTDIRVPEPLQFEDVKESIILQRKREVAEVYREGLLTAARMATGDNGVFLDDGLLAKLRSDLASTQEETTQRK